MRSTKTCILIAICVFALAGCAAPYIPYSVEISDSAKYAADLKTCQGYAAAYSPKFDAAAVAESAGEGAGGNAGTAAVTIWAPVLGAGGAVISTLFADAGLTQGTRVKITARCMKEKLRADHAGLAIDPSQ